MPIAVIIVLENPIACSAVETLCSSMARAKDVRHITILACVSFVIRFGIISIVIALMSLNIVPHITS